MTKRISIDDEALQNDIERTAEFGAVDSSDGRGRTALPADEANQKARDYFVDRCEDAGLNVIIDPVGNIAGRWVPAGADQDKKAVAAGSHLDSVPYGGIFDGPLGVYAALECVRAIQRSDLSLQRPVEVVSFTGEEGTRFAEGVLGSTVAAGKSSVEEMLSQTDGDITLEAALENIGYNGSGQIDACSWDSWIEIHIEQTTRLKDANVPLGVVTNITGTARCQVTLTGEADHAGATGMHERQDALTAASELIMSVERHASHLASEGSGTAVGTVGNITIQPNTVNVVPGEVSLRIDLRSTKQTEITSQLENVQSKLKEIETQRPISTTFRCDYDIPPTPLSDRCRHMIKQISNDRNVKYIDVHSGAGHDTMQIADVADAALLFVASQNGHSHSPMERADWEDCITASQVLANSIVQLAN